MANDTQANVQRIVDLVHCSVDAPLRLTELGELAGWSAFHLQRVFKAATGHSPAQRVRLLRLKRASMRLAMEPWRRVTDIALEAGYESGDSFSRAFRREMRQSPRKFRQHPD
ncbi:MAG: helix-turn-helix transcriptional regulator [Steroidobacteraceae bacterium]